MSAVIPPFQRGGGFGTLGTRFIEPALPAQVSLAPATFGAWATLILLGAGFVFLLFRLVRWRAGRRHRRVAQRELASLQQRWQGARADARKDALELLPRVLKGCALGSFGRARVAALSGASWLAFLRETGPGLGFEGTSGEHLLTLCERGASALSDEAAPALFAAAQRWVVRHHV